MIFARGAGGTARSRRSLRRRAPDARARAPPDGAKRGPRFARGRATSEAQKHFEAVRRLAPDEPLGWADGAVAAMRGKDPRRPRSSWPRRCRLAPSDASVAALEGVRPSRRATSRGDAVTSTRRRRRDPGTSPRTGTRRAFGGEADGPHAIRDVEDALEAGAGQPLSPARLSELRPRRRETPRRPRPPSRGRGPGPRTRSSTKALAEAKAALGAGDREAASLKYRDRREPPPRDAAATSRPATTWTRACSGSRSRTGRRISRRRCARGRRAIPVAFGGSRALEAVAGAPRWRASAGKDGRDLVLAGAAGLVARADPDGAGAARPRCRAPRPRISRSPT